jgi:NAD(P)-dependent dehydrogenase (short-subunit alcohol dehydrogenase family)
MFQADLLSGARILVTGGGTGLGKSMTQRFLELGAEVAICGRRKSVLDETAAELMAQTGGKVTTWELDIRNAEAVDNVVAQIWADGPLTGLVNGVGTNFISRTETLKSGEFDTIAQAVLHGTFYVTSSVGKRWIAEGLKGSIVSLVSTWVWTGSPFVTASSMSKAGIAAMTQGLSVEWGPKGVRLNAVAPGAFSDGTTASSGSSDMETDGVPMGRAGRPDELANLAVFLLSDACAYVTGEVIAIDGGQWLNAAGTFNRYSNIGDDDWKALKGQSWKGAPAKK